MLNQERFEEVAVPLPPEFQEIDLVVGVGRGMTTHGPLGPGLFTWGMRRERGGTTMDGSNQAGCGRDETPLLGRMHTYIKSL